jgi:hypothetical protein
MLSQIYELKDNNNKVVIETDEDVTELKEKAMLEFF